jgi:hypothetical protein
VKGARVRTSCRTGQVHSNVCSSLCLPVSVNDRAFSATDIFVVPPPGLGVDGLAWKQGDQGWSVTMQRG